MPGDHDGATCVAQTGGLVPVPALEHAENEARGKGISRAQHVVDLHGESGDGDGFAFPGVHGDALGPLLDHQHLGTPVQDFPDGRVQVAPNLGCGDGGIVDGHLGRVLQDRGQHLLFRTDGDVHQGQGGPHHDAVSPRVVPLVGAEVQVHEDGRAGPLGLFRGEQGRAGAGFPAQIRAREFEGLAVGDGGPEHVVDGEVDVGRVVPVEDQGKLVRGFDAQYHRATSGMGFAGDESRLHAFLFQEVEDKIPYGVLSHRGEQGGAQAQAPGTDRDVGGRASNIGCESGDFHKGLAYVQGVQVNGRTAHGEEIIGGFAHGRTPRAGCKKVYPSL